MPDKTKKLPHKYIQKVNGGDTLVAVDAPPADLDHLIGEFTGDVDEAYYILETPNHYTYITLDQLEQIVNMLRTLNEHQSN